MSERYTQKELRMMFDELQEVISVTDLDTYELLYLNRAGCALYHCKQYAGSKCYERMFGRQTPCSQCEGADITQDSFYKWEDQDDLPGGRFVILQKRIDWDGRPARLSILKRHGQAGGAVKTRQELEIEKTVVACMRSLVSAGDLEEAIRIVLQIICDFHKADRAYVFELHENGKYASNTYEWCKPGVFSEMEVFQNIEFDVDTARWYREMKENRPVIIRGADQMKMDFPPGYQMPAQWDTRAMILAPLLNEGGMMGFLGVDNPRYASDDASLMTSLSYFIANEITQRKLKEELSRLSYTDLLTGLYNRNRFMIALQEQDTQGQESHGVLFIDINGLKQANDAYGHVHGDDMIQLLATDMQLYFGQEVYRIGGDEFVIICNGCALESFQQEVSRFIQHAKEQPYSISHGCAWSDGQLGLQELIQLADQMMYRNKAHFYSRRERDRRNRMENEGENGIN